MEEQQNLTSKEYKDKYFLCYILFYLFGLVTQIPSNFFTTATDYWMYKFRDVNNTKTYDKDNKTPLQAEFVSDYTIVLSVTYALGVLLMHTKYRKITIFVRSIVCLCFITFLFLVTFVFVNIDTDSWQVVFFAITLTIAFFLSAFNIAFLLTLYEIAIKFPKEYLPPIFSGQSLGGIFTALTQIIALAIGGGAKTTGLIYFSIGLVLVLLTFAGFLSTWQKSEFFKHYLSKQSDEKDKPKFDKTVFKETLLSTFGKIKLYLLSMVLIVTSVHILQPGIITLVESVDKGNGNQWNDIYFNPVVNFLLYFVGDYVGRETALFLKKPSNKFIILTLSCLRITLVPLILLCNIRPRNNLPVIFDNDGLYIFFLLLFSFSAGFITNICMIFVPQITTEKERPFGIVMLMLVLLFGVTACPPIGGAILRSL